LHTEYKNLLLKAQSIDTWVNFLLKAENKWANQIEGKVEEMKKQNGGKDLISAFKTTYLGFERELGVGGSCREKGDEIQCHKMVYELLCIGQQMPIVIMTDEWRHVLAYKQFAINLAIHSLHFAHPEGDVAQKAKERLLKIAKNWIQIEELKNISEMSELYKLYVVPLVDKCEWDFGFEIEDRFSNQGFEKLCWTVQKLNKFYTELDEENGKGRDTQNVTKEVSRKIHDLIMKEDWKDLKNDCLATLTEADIISIDKEVREMGKTIKELNEEFEKALVKMNGELNEVVKKADTTIDSRKAAYKLLCIDKKMSQLFNESDKKNLKWAFQHFAAHLAVYSLRLDS
jgi:hypothetical protein